MENIWNQNKKNGGIMADKIVLTNDWRPRSGLDVPDSIRAKYGKDTHFVNIRRDEKRLAKKLGEGYVFVEHTEETKKAAQATQLSDALGKPVTSMYTVGDSVLMAISGKAFRQRNTEMERRISVKEEARDGALNTAIAKVPGFKPGNVVSQTKIEREIPE